MQCTCSYLNILNLFPSDVVMTLLSGMINSQRKYMMGNLVYIYTVFWSLTEKNLPLASLMLTQAVPRSLAVLNLESSAS